MKIAHPGQKVKIEDISMASFSESASENKINRCKDLYHLQKWRIFMVGEMDNIVVLVNEENVYVSIPIEYVSPVKRIYICGPITGIMNENKESFERYENKFLELGYDVVNPHKLDHDKHQKLHEEFMKVDLPAMFECDVVGLMFGQPWQKSKGCMIEIFNAYSLNIPIIDVETEKEIIFDIQLDYMFQHEKK